MKAPCAGTSTQECRVLHVLSALGIGGAETWLLEVTRFYSSKPPSHPRRVSCDFLLTSGKTAVLDEEFRATGANLFYVPYRVEKLLSFTREFRRILRLGCYNAIHIHQDLSAGVHLILGAGVLPTVRAVHTHNARAGLRDRRWRWLNGIRESIGKGGIRALATDVLAPSLSTLCDQGLSQVAFPRQVLRVLYCGVDVAKFRLDRQACVAQLIEEFGWQRDVKAVLFVGRLGNDPGERATFNEGSKNLRFALDVIRLCSKRDESVRLIVVGHGSSETIESFRALVRSWGLEDEIVLAGVREDVPSLMRGSSLLLFPSLRETLGMVAVEAQAAGLPVLASTNVPAEASVVDGAVKFLSLEAGPERWAAEVLRLLAHAPANRNEWSQQIEKSPFSIERSAEALFELYSGVPRSAEGTEARTGA